MCSWQLSIRRFRTISFALALLVALTAAGASPYDHRAVTAVKSAHARAAVSLPVVSSVPSVPPSWPPFVRIVPLANGEDVMVCAEDIGQPYRQLSADFGSTSHRWSHANLDYYDMEGLYRGMAVRALAEPCGEPGGCLRVYAYTAGGDPDPDVNVVAPYEFGTVGSAAAPDLWLYMAHLSFASPPFAEPSPVTHTVTLLMPPRAPASITGGWRILEGGLYVVESDGPDAMLQAVLAIYYDPDWLAWQGIAPETLQLWQWAPALGRWEPLPDSLSTRLHRVSAAISNLTAYALAAPPRAAVWLPLISSVIPSSN